MKKITFLTLIVSGFILVQNAKSQEKEPWITLPVIAVRENPFKGNVTFLKESKALYRSHCGSCHGNNGKGDGIAAYACDPKPADHTSDYVQSETDGSLYFKISEGRGPMPTFKATLTEEQIWGLVNYIRTLKAKK